MATMFRDESSTFVPQNIGILLTLLFFTYVLLSALFFTFLVRYLTGNAVSERVPTVVSIVALTVASLPTGLVPIDVFIVGYMKNSSGQFQPWAIDSRDRHDFSTTLLCAYYASYIATLFTTFVIIPLAYFFHKTETASSGRSRQNILPALCYTGLCIMILIILLSIGGVVPTREFPTPNSTLEEQFHIMLDDLKTSELEDMFSFALSAIRIVGLALITTYVGIGMVLGPINHIRGYPDPRTELAGVRNRRTGIQIEISSIQQNRITLPQEVSQLPRSEAIRLLSLEHEDLDLREREDHLKEKTKHWLSPFVMVCRPTQIGAGLIGLFIGLLIFVSIFMNNILRAMFSWGEHVGYLMPNVKVLNPLDRLSLFIQRVFPLDFILIIFLVTFLILAATSGFQKVGLGIPWIKTYKIKPWKTKSRSLLVFTANLILILLSVDILLLNLLPQYTTFSSQRYIACAENKTLQYPLLPTPLPDSAKEEKIHSLSHSSIQDECDESLVLPCDWTAPEGQCVMTRISVLWARVCYKTWYFGAMFYCITWIFLVVVVLEGCIASFRPSRRSNSAMILPDLESS
ncbi:probable lysosomal cobalamin transporter [Daphnia pulex]|uniref:probable lysosomal cobalamin transporter n=1 Tax=Daphnia pulex TaxID=6669 RepID=UPI001EDFAD59|nr:probable lysosomal cobalamin transporter [Daphnia pulex]